MDMLSKEHRSWNMSQIKSKDTQPELLLRSMLHRNGSRYKLHVKTLPGKPDLVFPRYRSVIFVNGCFLHRHNSCQFPYMPKSREAFWEDKFEKTIARDKRNEQELRNSDWAVITVWECELKWAPNKVIDQVTEYLQGYH